MITVRHGIKNVDEYIVFVTWQMGVTSTSHFFTKERALDYFNYINADYKDEIVSASLNF